jgi:hypothetical protein
VPNPACRNKGYRREGNKQADHEGQREIDDDDKLDKQADHEGQTRNQVNNKQTTMMKKKKKKKKRRRRTT